MGSSSDVETELLMTDLVKPLSSRSAISSVRRTSLTVALYSWLKTRISMFSAAVESGILRNRIVTLNDKATRCSILGCTKNSSICHNYKLCIGVGVTERKKVYWWKFYCLTWQERNISSWMQRELTWTFPLLFTRTEFLSWSRSAARF